MSDYQLLLNLVSDAPDCRDIDEYIAECGSTLPTENVHVAVDALQNIWAYAHTPGFPAILAASGLSLAAFARRYDVPLRSVEDWNAGRREAPRYVLDLLMSAVLGDLLE
ncbi:MAG: hypothetical protein VB039_05200 [Oscillospiraceae bacterium]|nr:hypothetical protein [Oscillospiraceae bacterium]